MSEILAIFAAQFRAVGATSVGIAAYALYSIAAELELEAIGLRAVEEALS